MTSNNLFIATFLAVLILIYSVVCSQPLTRKVTTQFLCSTPDGVTSYPNVVYSRAEGRNNTIHYIFSTVGVPAVLVVNSETKASLHVHCNDLLSGNITRVSGSVTCSETPGSAHAVLFNHLFEYNDVDDVSDMTKASTSEKNWRSYDLRDLLWDNAANMSNVTNNVIHIGVSRNGGALRFLKDGMLSLKFHLPSGDGRGTSLPRLQHNSQMSIVDFTLDRLDVAFAWSRFAAQMTLITSDLTGLATLESRRFLDDEYAPGVFQTFMWLSSRDIDNASYIQWKPVCYQKEARSLRVATLVRSYPLQSNLTISSDEISIARAYFGDTLRQHGRLLVTRANMSFGLTNDKFYKSTNYTSWTFAVGSGRPLEEQISLVIIFVIGIGLGFPALLFVIATGCICARKWKRRREDEDSLISSYAAIN